MSQLANFPPGDAMLLVSLPYKAGVWVSHSDDVDGERDDEREVAALEACIRAVAKLHEGQGFTSEVAREVLKRKDDWSNWAEQSFHADKDAQKAGKILKGLPESEAKDYRAFVMEIASSVARAHGEFAAFEDEPEGGLAGLVGKIATGFKGLSADDKNHPMNISATEDSAISTLAAALKG